MRWMRAIAATLASRFPSGPLIRLLIGVLIAVSVGSLALVFSAGYVTYRIVTEHNDTEVVTPASYLLSSYVNLNFTDRSGGEHEGWLLLGLRGAPVILLCHGYNSNRSELVSLGILLRENHFNVYLFNFRSLKERESYSALGLKQASDLLAAIDAITRQPAVNPRRVGLFGASTRSEEHTSELQSLAYLVCRLLLEKKKVGCATVFLAPGQLAPSCPSVGS